MLRKTLLTGFVCLCLPRKLKPLALRALGHTVAAGARIGFSVVLVDRLAMADGARIGHLNFIALRRLAMREGAYIGAMNIIKRGFSIRLAREGAIGNRNAVLKSWNSNRPSVLRIGLISKITAEHYVDLTECLSLGDYTTVAGVRSQIWTHGFIHDRVGPGRAIVTGPVIIGDNVYITTGCIINCGLRIGNAVSIGSGASIAKSLLEEGTYVPSPVRYIARTPEERVEGLPHGAGNDGNPHYRRIP